MTKALERRYRDSLRIAGTGMIALGIWTVVRDTLMLVAYNDEIAQYFSTTHPILMVVLPALLELALRLFVGFGARAEGAGTKSGSAYLVVAGLIACLHLVAILSYVLGVVMQEVFLEDIIVLVAIDTTCLYLTMDLIISAKRLRRLERKEG